MKARDADLVNPKIPTGEIEVFIRDMEVLGAAEELPLMVFGDQEYPEETRLRYRYLDLRREKMQSHMKLRSDMVASLRRRMWDIGFREYQTPIITASSPEGARDFLVPSRLHPGRFYALPQAPQQFKQLIMVSGFDKYFQIAPCFRDEDPRADRSPTDFYQLDMEMSFVEQQDIFDTIEPVMRGVFEEFGGGRKVDETVAADLLCRCRQMVWHRQAGPAQPDQDAGLFRAFPRQGFAIFAKLLEQEGTEIRAIPAPGGGSRKFCDRMNAFAQKEGLPGMGYIFWREKTADAVAQELGIPVKEAAAKLKSSEVEGGMEAAGPLAKNIGPERTEAIRQQLGWTWAMRRSSWVASPRRSKPWPARRVNVVIGEELGLTEQDRFAFAWIVDFPIFQKDDETGEIDFDHNPFSMPKGGMEALEADPLHVTGLSV